VKLLVVLYILVEVVLDHLQDMDSLVIFSVVAQVDSEVAVVVLDTTVLLLQWPVPQILVVEGLAERDLLYQQQNQVQMVVLE
jgi:hypothetical protein